MRNRYTSMTSRTVIVDRRALLVALTALSFLCVLCGSVYAQETNTTSEADSVTTNTNTIVEAGLTVSSVPRGAMVKLKGVSTLVGLSPVFFSQGLPGNYKLEISSPGYETYRSRVTVSNTSVTSVSVQLKKRTRAKATFRSMVWPGWGQFYSEKPLKGVLFSALALAAGVSLVSAHTNYQDKREEYDLAYADLLEAQVAGSLEDLAPLSARVTFALADAYDAETYQRTAVGVTAAVWGLSFLDALLSFPKTPGTVAPRSLTVSPDIDMQSGRSGVSLSLKF